MTTGDRIRTARESLKMTQEELAAAIGVQNAAVHKYESGLVVNLKRDVISKLAVALGVRPSWLLGYDVSTTFDEERLLGLFRAMSEKDRAVILATAEALAK